MKVRKIGDRWGDSAPHMYDALLKPQKISVGYFEKDDAIPAVGDLILVTKGHTAKAILKIASATPSSEDSLKDEIAKYNVSVEDSNIYVFRGEWHEIPDEEQFQYPTQSGNNWARGEYETKTIEMWKQLLKGK